MAEAVGLTASVIAIVELAAKITSLCVDYSKAVKSAKEDITRLQNQVGDFSIVTQDVQRLLAGPDGHALATSWKLRNSLGNCESGLENLRDKLDPGKSQSIRRLDFRALRWPFTSREVNDAISNLECHQRTIKLSLQLDST